VKFSLRFNNDLPARDYVRLAQAAEAAGFDQFWVSNDLFLRSAAVILSAIALGTKRIHIGTCIVNPYTLHPAEMAMTAATLDEISNGRFNLGISSGAAEFLKWVGITPEKPLTSVTETIHVLRRLFAGESAPLDGSFLHWTNEAYLRFEPPRKHIPIYIGAMSPRMLRAIGAVADGGLPLLLPPEHFETVLPYIREGLEKSNRTLDDIDLAACIWVSLSQDRAAAENVLKHKIAYYGHAMSPLIWDRLGLTQDDFRPIEAAIMRDGDANRAAQMVTPQMLKIGVVGTTHDLIARLEPLVDMGANHLSFGPPLGVDPLEAIHLLGRDVIPYFRKDSV
jgi:5,10-methylenetetrahydromethanopterin reductase